MEFLLVSLGRNRTFPFAIGLEDATLATRSPRGRGDDERGLSIADVFSGDFSDVARPSLLSQIYSQGELTPEPQSFGVLEVVHRVADDGQNSADLVFTGNPRQGWQNPSITQTDFETGPQYTLGMRSIASFDELISSDNGGRNAFYGRSNGSEDGRTHISMFGIPHQAPLSLADFQHADLSMTPFAPANQFGNSWASAYVSRDQVVDPGGETGGAGI